MRRAGTQYATRMDPSCVDFRVCECSRGAGLPLITFRYKTQLYSHERRFDPLDDRHREVLRRSLARDLEACGVATRNNRPFSEGDPDLTGCLRTSDKPAPFSLKVLTEAGCEMT